MSGERLQDHWSSGFFSRGMTKSRCFNVMINPSTMPVIEQKAIILSL